MEVSHGLQHSSKSWDTNPPLLQRLAGIGKVDSERSEQEQTLKITQFHGHWLEC